MQTFDQALYEAVTRGDVDMQEAVQRATHPHDFKLLVAAGGRLSTTMEHVGELADLAPVAQSKEPKRDTAPPGWKNRRERTCWCKEASTNA